MATVRQVIEAHLAEATVEISKVSMDTLLIDHGLDGAVNYDATLTASVKRAVLDKLNTVLMLQPDVVEGALSLKWDRGAVERYCDKLRAELGLPVAGEAIVRNRSSCW